MAPYPAVGAQVEADPRYQNSKSTYAARLRVVRIGVGDKLYDSIRKLKDAHMVKFINTAAAAKGKHKGDLSKQLKQEADRAVGQSKQTLDDTIHYIQLLETAVETSATVIAKMDAAIDEGQEKEQAEVVKWKHELAALGITVGPMPTPDPQW